MLIPIPFKLGCCWLLMQVILLSLHGIYIDGEAGKYVYEAHRLITGEGISGNNFLFYITTISLIYISVKAGAGFYLALLIQLLLNLLATLSFYQMTQKFTNTSTAFLTTLILIFFYPYQQFNVFLQTESIYFSLVVLLSSYLLQLRDLSLLSFVKILTLITLLSITRPTGLLICVPVGVYLHLRFLRKKSRLTLTAAYSLVLIAAGLLFNTILGSGGDLNFLLPFIQEHLICGVPTRLVSGASISQADNSIVGILTYVINNPTQVLRLGLERSLLFFGLHRDYFSTLHNALNITAFSTLYLLIICGSGFWFKKKKITLSYLLSFIAISWFTVFFTCDDWHNRFVLCLAPMFLLLAMPAMEKLINKISSAH